MNWNHYIGYIVVGGVGIAVSVVLVMADAGIAGLLAPAIIVLLYLALRFPEVLFVLFLNAGIYKADPRLEALQQFFDLTLFFELLCIVGILIGVIRGRVKIFRPPTKMLLPYLTIAGMATLSLMYTAAPIYGTEKLLRFLFLTSFSLWGPWVLFQDWRRIKRFFVGWVALSTAAIFDTLIGGLKPGEFMFLSAFGWSSGYQGLSSVTAQGALILLFGFFLASSNRWYWPLIFGLIIFNISGALISGARTSPIVLLVMLVSILVYKIVSFGGQAVIIGRVQFRNIYNFRIIISVVLVILSVAGILSHYGEYILTLKERIVVLAEAESTFDRIDAAQVALRALLMYPWGLGIGGFLMYYTQSDEGRAFAHNLFLEVGSELGWIGLIAFSLLCYWAAVTGRQALQVATEQPYVLGITLFSLFAFTLIYFQFHGDLNDARGLFTWIGSLFAYRRLVTAGGKNYAYGK